MISVINVTIFQSVTNLSLRRKMKLTKKQLISAAAITVLAGGIGLSSISMVSAQTGTNQDREETLASRIATKFNINKDEVKAEIKAQHDENRAEHEAEMKQNRETQLQKLVDSGKITADQKTAIIAKMDEMHTKMEELRNNGKTKEENKEAHKALHDEFKTWVESQNINMDDIRPEGKEDKGGRRGMHRGGMMEDDPDQSTSNTSSTSTTNQ
jgi:hypothetical protein